eukprot:TRINITY_DN77237_c0_g1_i1.p1 TRINITY_DN77237_c0_g1~~TRINITY_DN77237_c0_g1_i1.p1  ORF type:complete len:378 (+),score=77.01 TRINITY_DN77237_c0_g1_i1:88-1221(+)
MPSTASQVEVQAPPGLEFRAASSVGSDAKPGTKSEEEMKQELVKEVTAACKEHVEWKTAAAVEQLWQRGQKAMQYMQQQHQAQTEQLQSQLAACAESYQNLERENAVLRQGVEALMKQLTVLLANQHGGVASSPYFPPAAQALRTPPAEAPPAAPAGFPTVAAAPVQTPRAEPPAARSGGGDGEDFHTPVGGSPAQGVAASSTAALEELVSIPASLPQDRSSYSAVTPVASSADAADAASSSGGTGCEPLSVPPSEPPPPPRAEGPSSQLPTFCLTLRRADTVPVGLDVQGEDKCLLVERVRPGGAVEAWNRQCPGDLREIRAGDRIVMINGFEDPEGMRQECLTKHLLKMTVQRGTPIQPCNMRADADEFVPQVRP